MRLKTWFTGCKDYKALGLQNHQIKDEDITSSSYRHNHPAYHARVGHDAWCAETRDKYQWLQIDLHQTRQLLFIATQGNGIDAWVKTFYVEFSMDNITWYCFGNQLEAFMVRTRIATWSHGMNNRTPHPTYIHQMMGIRGLWLIVFSQYCSQFLVPCTGKVSYQFLFKTVKIIKEIHIA